MKSVWAIVSIAANPKQIWGSRPTKLTELGTITMSLSPSFKPSRCLSPQAHLAACSRSPPYVRLLFAIVSIWTTLSAGHRSGLYFVINWGIVVVSSKSTGQNGPLITDEDMAAKKIMDGGFPVRFLRLSRSLSFFKLRRRP